MKFYFILDEISKQLINSNAKILIGSADNYEVLAKAVKQTQKPIKIICTKFKMNETIPEGSIDFNELIDHKSVDYSTLKVYDINPNDCVFLPFSSGTTGMPKGVMLSHNNIAHNALAVHATIMGDETAEPYCLTTTSSYQEVLPCVLPFFHIYGFTMTLIAKLATGCKLVTLPKFHPDTFLNVLEKENATILHSVPPIGEKFIFLFDVLFNFKIILIYESGSYIYGTQ